MTPFPKIGKLGTIDLDLVEATPVVFRETLYRFEYVRASYWGNTVGEPYFRFVDHASGRPGAPFARGYHLGNVMVADDAVYVSGTNAWGGECVDLFMSRDLLHWESWNALNLPGYGLFNTSICRDRDRYVLMFEVGKPPEVAGVRFTARFATSLDLQSWELTPPECSYARDRYTAPHCLRYLDGYYYNFYLEKMPGGYEQHVVRSRDLALWESSPRNPVLRKSEEDRRIANPTLSREQRERVRHAVNVNNSDIDFCEFDGQLIITYSWGNQQGVEHLAEARFAGTEAQFLTSWFPPP